MDKLHLPEKVALTGADHFILALERHHKFNDPGGKMCRYIFDVEGSLRANDLAKQINSHPLIQWVSRFSIHESFFVKKWNMSPVSHVCVNELQTEEEYPAHIFNNNISKSNGPLLYFDVLHRKNNTTRLVLSWHHLLMDGYGAVLLMQSIAENKKLVIPKPEKLKLERFSFFKAVKAKFFVQWSAKGKISDLFSPSNTPSNFQIRTLNFSKENSERRKEKAIASGARFGSSPFFLSVILLTLKRTLESRGQKEIGFWVPVPQNDRKVGAKWPLIGNHLSFLFYRLFPNDLVSIASAVKSINTQMVNQIKEKMPRAYFYLMHYLKMAPSPLYYYWIRGPKGRTLSSFLFTIASDHPKDFTTIFGAKILNALSLPPNTYPPGITFAVTQFEQKTQVSILSYTDVISKDELDVLEENIKQSLLE